MYNGSVLREEEHVTKGVGDGNVWELVQQTCSVSCLSYCFLGAHNAVIAFGKNQRGFW
ncbi:hypothetical protein [Bartonella doshiae]|uniref:hypothetical protein n=1 Tax=Bartonella doshiae TaxID=33044 RepID=UPI000AF8012B|nr:hypothetical protein [Bartonella doshiae]